MFFKDRDGNMCAGFNCPGEYKGDTGERYRIEALESRA